MKLKNGLAILLAAGACVSVAACSDGGAGNTPPANVSYEVSAEEWHSALTFENIYNYKVSTTSSNQDQIAEIDGFLTEQYTEFDGTTLYALTKRGSETQTESYFRHEGDYYYEYSVVEGGKVQQYEIAESHYNMIKTTQMELFEYESFSYDETSKSYVAEEIVFNGITVLTYTDMAFQFVNGKLTSVTGKLTINGATSSMVSTVTYGTVQPIVLPELVS